MEQKWAKEYKKNDQIEKWLRKLTKNNTKLDFYETLDKCPKNNKQIVVQWIHDSRGQKNPNWYDSILIQFVGSQSITS